MTIMKGSICRAARGLLNWSTPRLAREAGVPVQVIFDLERDRPARIDDQISLERAFRAAGVAVMTDDRGGVGVYFLDAQNPAEVSARPARGGSRVRDS